MITKELFEEIALAGGATLDAVYHEGQRIGNVNNMKYASGYAVSIKGYELVTHKLTIELLDAYIEMYKEFLENNPAARVGVWFNLKDGKIYLDISKVYQNIYNALDEAAANKQKAIYDFARGVSINRLTMEVMK